MSFVRWQEFLQGAIRHGVMGSRLRGNDSGGVSRVFAQAKARKLGFM
jgi:hypothetical protein